MIKSWKETAKNSSNTINDINQYEMRASREGAVPSVTAEVLPIFFQRASLVVVQLVRDHLSKTFLGSLETYADGETHKTKDLSHFIFLVRPVPSFPVLVSHRG